MLSLRTAGGGVSLFAPQTPQHQGQEQGHETSEAEDSNPKQTTPTPTQEVTHSNRGDITTSRSLGTRSPDQNTASENPSEPKGEGIAKVPELPPERRPSAQRPGDSAATSSLSHAIGLKDWCSEDNCHELLDLCG